MKTKPYTCPYCKKDLLCYNFISHCMVRHKEYYNFLRKSNDRNEFLVDQFIQVTRYGKTIPRVSNFYKHQLSFSEL